MLESEVCLLKFWNKNDTKIYTSVYYLPNFSKYTAYKCDDSASDLHVEAFAISRSPPVKENWKAGECIKK